jgi:hypothetical protein
MVLILLEKLLPKDILDIRFSDLPLALIVRTVNREIVVANVRFKSLN